MIHRTSQTVFPELSTERLVLRQIVPADQAAVFAGLSNPEVIKFYGVSYASFDDTQVQMDWFRRLWKQQEGIWWGICFKEDPSQLVGACGFNNRNKEHRNIELGYWLLPDHWGKGIMTEALPHILQFAFRELDIHRVVAVVEGGNDSSMHLLTKLGFAYEGTHKECEIKGGQFIDLSYFALLQRNFSF
jgi:[ribosomal protein S5]-alanine N-acetyltransferase